MNISDRVMLIGSGKSGSSLTHTLDCNAYLLDCGGEYALIDAGAGIEPELMLRRIDEARVDRGRITHLLLTHVHGDHAGGAEFFKKSLYNASVVCPEESAPWLEQADLDKTSLRGAIKAGVYPPDYRFSPCGVDRTVKDGDILTIGDVALHVIETPGHARGHVGYWGEEAGVRYLFSGDAVFSGGKIVLQNIWDCSIQDYACTIAKLYELRPDRLYPGHGPFIWQQA